MSRNSVVGRRVAVLVLGSLVAFAALAQREPDFRPRAPALFRTDALYVANRSGLALADGTVAQRDRAHALPNAESARVDLRTGRFQTLMPSVPLLPGTGVGNRIAGARPSAETDRDALAASAWQALRAWLVSHADALAIDVREFGEAPRVTVIDAEFIQVNARRTLHGIPVRDAMFTATISRGNLILLGVDHWADAPAAADAEPALSAGEALAALGRHVAPLAVGDAWKAPALEWLPMPTDVGGTPGLTYRLAWVLRTPFEAPDGLFEALVDAHSGEVLAIADTVHYATPRAVAGGAFAVSNDNTGPDSFERALRPMPYTDVITLGEGTFVTDEGGNAPVCLDGVIDTTLTGRYVRVEDACGTIGAPAPAMSTWARLAAPTVRCRPAARPATRTRHAPPMPKSTR